MRTEPPYRTFALSGLPRGGTTYLAAVLHHPPRVVTLSEAGGRWKRLYESEGRRADVLAVFAEFRDRIARGEPVPTFEFTPGFDGQQRVDTWSQRKIERPIETADEFHFGMKNPEVFLEFLDIFDERGVRCVVSVRHPLSVINSWVRRVQGKVRRGASIDGTFANGDCTTYRARESDPVGRRIDLFNHLAGRIEAGRDRPNILIIRHEDWYHDADQLERICSFLRIPSPGVLRPAPIAPDPIELSPEETARILEGCTIAATFGYPLQEGRLAAPVAASGLAADR